MSMGDAGVPTEALPPKIQYQERLFAAAKDVKRLEPAQVADTKIQLASKLHDDWRQGYIRDNRTGEGPDDYKPRWKAAGTDTAWLTRAENDESIKKIHRKNPDTGADEVDIAHASYDQLPEKWQAENRDAAATAVNIIDTAISEGKKIDNDFLEEAASTVHDAWRQRNSWVKDDPSNVQGLDYSDPKFPEAERDKDREHVVLASEFYAKAQEAPSQ